MFSSIDVTTYIISAYILGRWILSGGVRSASFFSLISHHRHQKSKADLLLFLRRKEEPSKATPQMIPPGASGTRGAVDFCAADCYGEPRIHVRCPLTAISSIREMPERMNTPYTPIQTAVEAIAEQAGTVVEDFHSGRSPTTRNSFSTPRSWSASRIVPEEEAYSC